MRKREGTGDQARTGFLFGADDLREVETPDLVSGLADKALRVVRWPLLTERPCLVVCAHGEHTIQQIRSLVTLCGISCTEAVATSAVAPRDTYCQTCLSKAGRGALR